VKRYTNEDVMLWLRERADLAIEAYREDSNNFPVTEVWRAIPPNQFLLEVGGKTFSVQVEESL
jgi:hypothetical protein